MGEYYCWVNVDRKEYICPADFDYGNKRYESCHRDGEVMRALRHLLANEWKGCRIFWMGDERELPEEISNELFEIIRKHCDEISYGRDMADTVFETYRDVSGLYKAAETNVREEIGYYLEELARGNLSDINTYGIDTNKPYEGLFCRDGIDAKYIVDYSKKVCYSFSETKILYQDGSECDFADPLPMLLGYGRVMEQGEWVGDIIGVEEECPNDINILESITLDW